MSYLDNSTTTVDAILTKKGRERFADGTFNVTQFALSDDEIDYSLYNTAHPDGSDYYSMAIEHLPLLEAISDETKVLKYKIITLPKGTAQIPLISTGISNITLYMGTGKLPGQSIVIAPSTVNGLNSTLGYTAILDGKSYVTLKVKEALPATIAVRDILPGTIDLDGIPIKSVTSTTVVGKSFILTAMALPPSLYTTGYSSTLTIHGNETGGSVTMIVNITSNYRTVE